MNSGSNELIEICEFCNSSVKNKYNLKNHLIRNKKCLKLRGLSLITNFICKGCQHICTSNINLLAHIETCKEYIILKVREECSNEYKEEIEKIKNKEKVLLTIKNKLEKDQKNYNKNLDDIKNKLDISDKLLIETQTQLQTLQKFSDKTISDAHIQIQTLQKIIENIAKKAVDKPTNTVVNQIRNCFSDKYFVDDIKESDVKRKCQTYLTEQILMEGQRGIARLCTEHIINTNDNKKLLIATDQSRNKFRYMDEKGNIKDDIEARTFIEKVSKPIKEVAEIVFDNVLSTIKDEKETIEKDDYGRKAELNDKELQANHSMVYIKCFDDPKHNTDFTNELAILNKTK